MKVFLLLKRPRDVFEKVSRRERDRRGVREVPRLRASRRLSIGEAKARLRRFVENPNKKKNEEERARRDVHMNTSVSSCTECPGAYPAYTMFPFLFAGSLSLSTSQQSKMQFFFTCVCRSFFEVSLYFSTKKKRKSFRCALWLSGSGKMKCIHCCCVFV